MAIDLATWALARGAFGEASRLQACSSEADDPSASYIFLNGSSPVGLESAFSEIANQLTQVRRVC